MSHVPKELLERVPPQNGDAENQVIGAMLRDPEIIPEVLAKLTAEDFYHFRSQKLFAIIAELSNARRPVQLDTVFKEIENAGLTKDIGGAKFLAELWESVPTAVAWEYHAAQVRRCAACRALIHVATEAVRDAYQPNADIEEIAARLCQGIDTAVADRTANDPVTIEAAVAEGIEQYRANHKKDTGRLRCGWKEVDSIVPSLEPGQLIIVGARPSVGKSALGVCLGMNAAYHRQVPTLFISLEMPRVQIGQRVAVSMTDTDSHRLNTGWASPTELANVGRAVELVRGTKFYVDDTPSQRMASIMATCRRMKRRNGLGLVIVDYLQIVAPDSRSHDRRIQVEQVSRDLKRMARELAVPVVALAQLNREVEARGDGKPRLADLREAGGIEQDADTVMLLWRHPNQADDEKLWRVGLSIAKQRNGPTGEATLDYNRSAMRFQDRPTGVPM